MPQDPRPRLQPVASPTDPFVTPGVKAPKLPLGGVNFEALRGLSQTVNDFAQAEAQIQDQVARNAQEPNEAALANLDLGSLQSLTSNKPLTDEVLKKMTAAGVQALDNPVARMNLKRAAGAYQVLSNDYSGYLTDPEFIQKNAATALNTSEDQANADLGARREEFLKKFNIDATSVEASNAIASKMKSIELSYLKERADVKARLFEQESDRRISVAVSAPIAEALKVLEDPKNVKESMKFMGREMSKILETEALMGRGAKAEESFFRQFEAQMDRSISAGVAVDPLHALDLLEENMGRADFAPRFAAMASRLQAAVDRQESVTSRNAPEARVTAQSRIENELSKLPAMSSSEYRDWLYTGPGRDIIDKVAAEFKVSPDLLGNIREPIQRNWTERGETDKSNPEVLRNVAKMIHEGKVEEADAILASAPPSDLTTKDLRSLYSDLETAKARASSDNLVKSQRRNDFGNVWSALGPLPPEAAQSQSTLQAVFDSAYNAHIDANKNDLAGANQAAQQAVMGHPAYLGIKQLQETIGFPRLASSDEYRSKIIHPLEQLLNAEAAALKSDQGEVDPYAMFSRGAQIRNAVEAEMTGLYEKLTKDPEVLAQSTQLGRNATILRKMSGQLKGAVDRAQGLRPEVPKTLATAQLNNDTQLKQMEVNYGLTRQKVKQMTPIGTDSGIFFNGAYTANMSNIDEYLTALSSGDPRPFTDKYGGVVGATSFSSSKQAVIAGAVDGALETSLAMSSRLVDNFNPKSIEDAGNLRAGDILVHSPKDRTELRNVMRGVTITLGMSPKEAIKGQLRSGIGLQEIFGSESTSWVQSAPIRMIPFYATEDRVNLARESVAADPEKSEGAKLMIALGLDPTNNKSVQTFFDWQVELARKRSLSGDTLRKMNRYYSSGQAIQAGDPAWLKKAKQREADFMSSGN